LNSVREGPGLPTRFEQLLRPHLLSDRLTGAGRRDASGPDDLTQRGEHSRFQDAVDRDATPQR
jgi:hypothetical protein